MNVKLIRLVKERYLEKYIGKNCFRYHPYKGLKISQNIQPGGWMPPSNTHLLGYSVLSNEASPLLPCGSLVVVY